MTSEADVVSFRKVRAPKWSSLRDAGRTIFEANPLDRVSIVKAGVPAIFVITVTKDMGLAKERFYGMTGLARATVDRKVARKHLLNQAESERVVGFAELVGQVENMVRESGAPQQFDGPRWIAAWLERSHPALGGRKPGDLLDTADGRSLVRNLLARQQSGAYA
jgi:putative toxin-antitoxin system antitoxin component (TIGR02293 family)